MSISTISAMQFAKVRQQDDHVELIDVRTPVEFGEVHLDVARNVPLDQLNPGELMRARNDASGETLYIICQSGGRGRQACEKFLQAGFANVVNIDGGTLACVKAGVPVVRGEAAISLERQVRIAAGSVVLLGILLAWYVHPAFIAVSAFAGAGLVFAGITDTCGMGLLLARMPWNRCRRDGSTCHTA